MIERELAQATAAAIKSAIAPILQDVKALQSSVGAWELRWNDLGALRERVAVLETRAPIPGPVGPQGPQGPAGEKGERGVDGKDGAPGLNGKDGVGGATGLNGAPGADGKDGAPGKDGRDGLDGKDGAPGLNGKDGADGRPGKDGANGLDGKDGADGLNGKDGRDGVNGKDGAPGLNGKDGAPGRDGVDGRDGLNGKDGAGIADAVIDREGQLVLTFTDGRTKSVGVVLGKDGAPGVKGIDGAAGRDGRDGADGKDGTPGRDGLSPEDFDWDFDPETRHFTMKFLRGGIVIAERTKTLTGMRIYRGVFEQGKAYELGDVVTWGGSEWTAMAQTKDRPGNGATAWKLTVKHGDQGKVGPKGDPGRDGRDLTQMDGQGRKW